MRRSPIPLPSSPFPNHIQHSYSIPHRRLDETIRRDIAARCVTAKGFSTWTIRYEAVDVDNTTAEIRTRDDLELFLTDERFAPMHRA
jgi:hypothetical protein